MKNGVVNEECGKRKGERENEYMYTYTSNIYITGTSEQGNENHGTEQTVQDIIQENFPEIRDF